MGGGFPPWTLEGFKIADFDKVKRLTGAFGEPPTPPEKVQTLECLAPDENVIVFVSRWTCCQGQKRW